MASLSQLVSARFWLVGGPWCDFCYGAKRFFADGLGEDLDLRGTNRPADTRRPGALRGFVDTSGPEDDIARLEYLKKSSKNFGSILLGIETKDPGNFDFLFERMLEQGFQMQDITTDPVLADFII